MAHGLNTSDHARCHDRDTVESGQPIMSAVMFSAGVAGNIIAVVLLEMRRRRRSASLFRVLVTALLVTDLLGTVSVSPVVLSSYALNRTLVAMSDGGKVCSYFGFSMTFLSLSTLAILCAMALERSLSIGYPYFYERHLSKRCGYVTVALIYLACVLFCVAPFMGFGAYMQYCPGTWCFMDMSPEEKRHKVYSGFYASFILIMITGTVACNVSAIYFLVLMRMRRKAHRVGRFAHSGGRHRSLSMTEEVGHLLLLVFITVAFIFCSFPLVLRVYINFMGRTDESHAADLNALRMLSFNSIIDPWLFIFLSPSVLRIIWRKLCREQRSVPDRRKTLAVQSTLASGVPCCQAAELQSRESTAI
ncbi:prostaglandin E2 receptor EP2 subtype-like [Myripristis murdjan]|uniref:prostaglandin E2 receptor EP2 subtype-like n=1 Tax=Myripristis murdjan TaxID=586833 RepID=UPI001175DBFC|nr:prostaglandin E2 receptor EP2 subtype-like [Myripristis murdjan]